MYNGNLLTKSSSSLQKLLWRSREHNRILGRSDPKIEPVFLHQAQTGFWAQPDRIKTQPGQNRFGTGSD